MMNTTDLDAQLAAANAQSQGQPQVQQAPKSFWQRNWPRIFILLSLVVAVLTFVGIILNFIQIIIKPNVTLLNIYCLIFSLLALSAELRQFRWFRKISYHWMKYVYFLTYYKPRGVFYILLGLLLLGDMAILYVAGAVAIVVGLVILVTSFIVGLPVYEDPQEQRREQEEARRYYEGRNAKPAGFFAKHFGVKQQAGGQEATQDTPAVPSQAPPPASTGAAAAAAGAGGYQPPTLPLREGHTAADEPAASYSDVNSPASPGEPKPGFAITNSPGAFSTASAQGNKAPKPQFVDSDDDIIAAAQEQSNRMGTAMFKAGSEGETPGAAAAAATTTPAARKDPMRPVGESQLRREFAAAMGDDGDEESLR